MVIYSDYSIFFFLLKQKGGSCLIPFAKIRDTTCPGLAPSRVVGNLVRNRRLHAGGVTDSSLACSTSDTGESSVRTCCGTADGGRKDNMANITHTHAGCLSHFTAGFGPEKHILATYRTFVKMCVHESCIRACGCVCVLFLNAVNQESSGSPSRSPTLERGHLFGAVSTCYPAAPVPECTASFKNACH